MTALISFSDRPTGRDSNRARQLVCNIWILNGSEIGDAVHVDQPIAVGAESSTAPSQLSLPGAGRYLVELIHPRGRHTRRTVEVQEDGEVTVEVPTLFTSTTKSVASTHYHLDTLAARVVMSSALQPATPELEVLAFATAHSLDASLLNARGFVAGVLSCRRHGHTVARFPSAPAEFEAELPGDAPLDLHPPIGRAWLLARGGTEKWTLISYPETWPKQGALSPLILRARRPESASLDATWTIRLGIADPALEALLEFLSGRDWSSARAVFKEIRRTGVGFDNTLDEPFVAAIAAYVEALAIDEPPSSHEMAMNCLAGNYWMPDIGIAVGWKLLRDAESKTNSFVNARRLILEAVDRGLPYFTVGLRVLSDALNYLTVVDAKDQPAKRALAAVTRATLACSPEAVFTTVDVSKYLNFSQKS